MTLGRFIDQFDTGLELVSGASFLVEAATPTAGVGNRGMLFAQGILRLMRIMLTVPPRGW